MTVYEKALGRLLAHEGGYVNNPNDTGGETMYGISRKWFPRWSGWEIVDAAEDKQALKDDETILKLVGDFYYTYFWYKIKAHMIDDPEVAEMLFITAVNVGKRVAVRKTQRILGVAVDGIIGDQTVGALNSIDSEKFLYQFVLELVDFYLEISARGNNHLFLKGWLNRAMSFYYRHINA